MYIQTDYTITYTHVIDPFCEAMLNMDNFESSTTNAPLEVSTIPVVFVMCQPAGEDHATVRTQLLQAIGHFDSVSQLAPQIDHILDSSPDGLPAPGPCPRVWSERACFLDLISR